MYSYYLTLSYLLFCSYQNRKVDIGAVSNYYYFITLFILVYFIIHLRKATPGGLTMKKPLILILVSVLLLSVFSLTSMAQEYVELLVKTSDNVLSDSPRELWTPEMFAEERAGNSKQGYIIVARPEGSLWGKSERDPMEFAIVKILASEWNQSWLEPEYDYGNPIYDIDGNLAGYPVKTERAYKLPLESFLSANELSELKGTPCDGSVLLPGIMKTLENTTSHVVYNDWRTRPYDWVKPGDPACQYYASLGTLAVVDSSSVVGYARYDEVAGNKFLTLTQPITSEVDNATIQIPNGTTITSGNLSWNGTVAISSINETGSIKIKGVTKKIFEIGLPGVTLTFDKAVRILIPGEAGNLIGYTRVGEPFQEITTLCSSDTQEAGDALPAEGDCKIDATSEIGVTSDLVVWTKHFTEFITYVLNTPPVADANGPYEAKEGTAIPFDASGSSDTDTTTLEYRWNFEGVWTEWSSSPYAEHTWNDDYSGTIMVEVSDGNLTDNATATVTISNIAPVIESLVGPIDPVQKGEEVQLTGIFTDHGLGDTHTAVVDWGDTTTTTGSVENGTATGTHTYTEAGVYTVKLIVTDDDGGNDEAEFQYVVVYDPDGGFVIGGGWIYSPEGAYKEDLLLTGRANFGFVSKYMKGANVPSGNTEFQFKAGNLNFHSDSYQWLVITNKKAMYKGVGTINTHGNYGFLLSAIDGDLNGGSGIDKFRIKIWDISDDRLVYDNNIADENENADPATALGGGQIVISNPNAVKIAARFRDWLHNKLKR